MQFHRLQAAANYAEPEADKKKKKNCNRRKTDVQRLHNRFTSVFFGLQHIIQLKERHKWSFLLGDRRDYSLRKNKEKQKTPAEQDI